MTELQRVKRAAAKAAAAREELDQAMREAHAAGASLRKIAEAAGVSYEQVRRVVSS
jgi:hypothetical protein